jgi:hypothetical protein
MEHRPDSPPGRDVFSRSERRHKPAPRDVLSRSERRHRPHAAGCRICVVQRTDHCVDRRRSGSDLRVVRRPINQAELRRRFPHHSQGLIGRSGIAAGWQERALPDFARAELPSNSAEPASADSSRSIARIVRIIPASHIKLMPAMSYDNVWGCAFSCVTRKSKACKAVTL